MHYSTQYSYPSWLVVLSFCGLSFSSLYGSRNAMEKGGGAASRKYNQPKIISTADYPLEHRIARCYGNEHIRRTSGKLTHNMKVIEQVSIVLLHQRTQWQLWDGKTASTRRGRWNKARTKIKVRQPLPLLPLPTPPDTDPPRDGGKHVRRTSHMFGIQSADL